MELHAADEEDEALEEEEAGEEAEETVDEVTDNVGDPSVEINVEDLLCELEAEGFNVRVGREHAAKRRLEELMEEKRARRDLEDFEDYEI
jgi:hypothetical protein